MTEDTKTPPRGREWTRQAGSDLHWSLSRLEEDEPGTLVFHFGRAAVWTRGFDEHDLPAPVLEELAAGAYGPVTVEARALPSWTGGGSCIKSPTLGTMITLDRDALGDRLADTFAHEVGHALERHPVEPGEYRQGLGSHEQARAERAAEDYADRWRTPEQRTGARARLSPELRTAMYPDGES